jgi:hypothetical protein
MTTTLDRSIRRGLWALPLWAALLLIGTTTHQPDYTTDFPAYARYITTTHFLISHLIASILGAACGILGMVALASLLVRGRTVRLALWGFASFVVGTVLVTSVFGAAAYAQPAIGRAYLAGHTEEAMAINADVYGPALFAMAAAGILLFTLGIVLIGVAVARSGLLPRGSGIGLALAGVLFGPVGFVLGPVQTAGAALLVVVAAWLAGAGQRPEADERDAGSRRVQGVAASASR